MTIGTGKDLIIAADRYGVPGLKLAVETTLVEALMLNSRNCADWLLFADLMTCPLLKEQAVSYFVFRAADLVNSGCSQNLKDSPRLMLKVSNNSYNDPRFANSGMNMAVNELRKKA